MGRVGGHKNWSRKPVDREAKAPYVLLGQGELNIGDRTLLSQLLGHFGVKTEFMTQEAYEDRMKRLTAPLATHAISEEQDVSPSYRFSDITRPDQFLLREHFEDLKATYQHLLPDRFVGRVFNHLVDGGDMSRRSTRYVRAGEEVRPPKPPSGIIISSRDELGIPPYEQTLDSFGKSSWCATYAVQAGSVVDFAAPLADELKLSMTENVIQFASYRLQQQFIAQE